MSERFILNVSGRKFEVSRSLLEKYPQSRLSQACLKTDNKDEIFFERPITAFEAILEFYQTGNLHIPDSLCYSGFTDEVKFWGFSECDISVCCQRKLASFRSGQRDINEYEQYEMSYTNYLITEPSLCGCMTGKWRSIVWNTLDNCAYNLVAKVLYVISIMLVLTSTVVAVLLTHEEFDEPLGRDGWQTYFGHDYDDYQHLVEFVIQRHHGGSDNHTAFNITDEEMAGFPHEFSVKNSVLTYIAHACTIYFTIELIFRLSFCPSMKMFFKFGLNIIDVLAVLAAYVDFLVNFLTKDQVYRSNYIDLIQLLQVLRVLRLFRLTRNIIGARVLVFAAKNSLKELFFMSVLLTINAVIFATLVYCVDGTFENISYAIWWAAITMTTVGYGDIVPSNTVGRVVGVVCASTGIVLIALTIPLFVNNFLAIYTFAQSMELVNRNTTRVHPRENLEKEEKQYKLNSDDR